MINDYDPEVEPESNLWLETDESERENVVTQFCEANEADLPNVHLHAHIHVVVENQAAIDERNHWGQFSPFTLFLISILVSEYVF